jgi:hypothetical protein
MYPNPALPAWQMAIMAVVPVVALAVWLIAIYVAARKPGGQDLAVVGSPAGPAAHRPAGRLIWRPDADVAIRPPDGLSGRPG